VGGRRKEGKAFENPEMSSSLMLDQPKKAYAVTTDERVS
jgi:hypothetical protein